MSRRKPPHLRQNRITKDLVVPDVAVATPPLPEHPNPPAVWGPAAQRRWESMWTSAVAPAYGDADRPLMTRLLLLEDEAHRAAGLVDAAPMVKGSTGQLRTNPMAKQLKDLRAEIRNLEDRLGLSPKGRLGLGLTVARTAAAADLTANGTAGRAMSPLQAHNARWASRRARQADKGFSSEAVDQFDRWHRAAAVDRPGADDRPGQHDHMIDVEAIEAVEADVEGAIPRPPAVEPFFFV